MRFDLPSEHMQCRQTRESSNRELSLITAKDLTTVHATLGKALPQGLRSHWCRGQRCCVIRPRGATRQPARNGAVPATAGAGASRTAGQRNAFGKPSGRRLHTVQTRRGRNADFGRDPPVDDGVPRLHRAPVRGQAAGVALRDSGVRRQHAGMVCLALNTRCSPPSKDERHRNQLTEMLQRSRTASRSPCRRCCRPSASSSRTSSRTGQPGCCCHGCARTSPASRSD